MCSFLQRSNSSRAFCDRGNLPMGNTAVRTSTWRIRSRNRREAPRATIQGKNPSVNKGKNPFKDVWWTMLVTNFPETVSISTALSPARHFSYICRKITSVEIENFHNTYQSIVPFSPHNPLLVYADVHCLAIIGGHLASLCCGYTVLLCKTSRPWPMHDSYRLDKY